jgi:hypothetical protein
MDDEDACKGGGGSVVETTWTPRFIVCSIDDDEVDVDTVFVRFGNDFLVLLPPQLLSPCLLSSFDSGAGAIEIDLMVSIKHAVNSLSLWFVVTEILYVACTVDGNSTHEAHIMWIITYSTEVPLL